MFFSFLASWWQRRRTASPDPKRFVMYTRQGCHLCEDAWRLLEEVRQRHDIHLGAVDIDTDPELAAKFGAMVPVVEVDGKVRFWGRINRVLVERLIRAERR